MDIPISAPHLISLALNIAASTSFLLNLLGIELGICGSRSIRMRNLGATHGLLVPFNQILAILRDLQIFLLLFDFLGFVFYCGNVLFEVKIVT